ncbi:MAG: alpha/beta fold hydrolase, partial [Chloroflexi bacterium]|nr:alpha/beta fold hydrolase [Chloroflexota bacterium]
AVSAPGWGELVLRILGRYRWEVRWEYSGLFHDPSLFTPQMAAEVLANRARPRAAAILLSMLRQGVTWRGVRGDVLLLDRLPLVQAPTLIAWGAQDPLFPLSHARRAQQGIPRSRLEVFPDCRHCPQLEYPERFNDVVGSFLAAETANLALDAGPAPP